MAKRVCLSVSLSVCLSVCLSVRLSVSRYVCPWPNSALRNALLEIICSFSKKKSRLAARREWEMTKHYFYHIFDEINLALSFFLSLRESLRGELSLVTR